MAQILIRLPEERKNRLQMAAQAMGVTMNALILQILWDWQKNEQGR